MLMFGKYQNITTLFCEGPIKVACLKKIKNKIELWDAPTTNLYGFVQRYAH
jgi:hypothetical protein